jgi:hypothetical protein
MIGEGWMTVCVQGMFRRGLHLEALKEFVLAQAASKSVLYGKSDKGVRQLKLG